MTAKPEEQTVGRSEAAQMRNAGPVGRMGAAGMPMERSKDFGNSARRLLRRLTPERGVVVGIIGLTIVSVTLTVIGPRVLGQATDVVFRGLRESQGIDFDHLHRVLLSIVVIYIAASGRCSARCIACDQMWKTSSIACRSATSIASRAATCSAG
jgi:ATP-binding cassette, subfamily B, multidrug efflux pump